MQTAKNMLLKYFDWFVFFYHVLFFFYICSNVASAKTVMNVYAFFVLSIILTFVMLKLINWLNLTEYKMKIFIGEIFFSFVFVAFFRYTTYSEETFIGYIFAILCYGFLCANKYLFLIPIISTVAAFILPEYLFSYFQVVNIAFLLQCNKKLIKKEEYKKYILISYLLQLISMLIRILFFSKGTILSFNYFDGNINKEFSLVFLFMAGCIAYGYGCIKNSSTFIKYSFIGSLLLIPIGSIFLRDIHVYYCAIYIICIELFFFERHEGIKDKIERIKDNLLPFVFIVFFMKIFICLDTDIISEDLFTISAYYFNYFDFGFTQRSLIGTLFYLLFGYYIPENKFYMYATIFYVVNFVFLAYILYRLLKVYRKSANNDKSYVPYLLLFMYISSAPYLSYMYETLIYRLDLYGMCLAILSVYCIYKNRYIFVVPIMCALGMINHQIFVFIIFPIVFIAFIYRIFIEPEGYFKRNLIAFIMMISMIVGIFIYLQFFSYAFTAVSGEEAVCIVRERSCGFLADNKYIDGELSILTTVIFADAETHVQTWQNRITFGQIINTIGKLLYSLPLIVLFFYAFFKSSKYEDSKFKKFIYYALPFSIVAFLPTYILETDYGRWNQHLFATFMLGLFILTIMQKPEKKWYRDMSLKKKQIWFAIVYVIMIEMPLFTRAF